MQETYFQPIKLDKPVGEGLVRRTGREKVTGGARYSAEWPVEGLLYAVPIVSTIPRGSVTSIDTRAAEAMPGVRWVMTPDNAPKVKQLKSMNESNFQTSLASSIYPGMTKEVYFAGQYLGAVVADTFETARDAALAVEVSYQPKAWQTDIGQANPEERPKSLFGAPPVITVGNVDEVLEECEAKVVLDFSTADNYHNPIEPHAAIAEWTEKDGQPFLKVYESTQSLALSRATYAQMFQLKPSQVHVVCKVIGGAFGSKGSTWPHSLLAIFCAKAVQAPVKVVVSRQQLYGGTGHRTPTRQQVTLGARASGKIRSIIHSGYATTARQDTYSEAFTMATRMMYGTEALRLDQRQCRLDTQCPTFMRAPAETPGMFALESAMDELACQLDIDPIELRVLNEPEKTPYEDKPFSSRLLIDCLKKGAEAFQWARRPVKPGISRDGDWVLGYGVAAATYPCFSFPTQVEVEVRANGTARILCCSHEMGTGTATVQSQLLANLLGITANRISMELGDTDLPPGGLSGGSATTMSVGGAVQKAVENLKRELQKLAPKDSPLSKAKLEELQFAQGKLTVSGGDGLLIEALLENKNRESLRVEGAFQMGQDSPTANHSYGATFVEVGVDEELGIVRVRRLLGCYACGTILNSKTARSQFLGGMIMGIGHALQEATVWDHRLGRITNDDLAEYHVPVNADIPDIDIHWLDDPDFNASPIGAKGIGEISITGVAAAVANAIRNATGKRLTELPIRPHHVMS